MSNNRIRGLKGRITMLERHMAANKRDIVWGLPFHHMLKSNKAKLAHAKAKLEEELKRDQA